MHSVLRGDPAAVTPVVFHKAYDEILNRTKEAFESCQILLIDPFYISNDRASQSFRNDVLTILQEYVSIVHALSEKYQTRLVKTHDLFQRLIRFHEPDTFCPEPVHPNLTGHLAIAEAVYAALSQ
ncbi:hypothetical protein JXJ21_01655 [candidate division KSB1 bacterium]|nr:hypothetical protein [candidate division KSB1 bacterium]